MIFGFWLSQLHSVIGVVPGKELNAVLVADKHFIAQKNIG